MSDVLKDDGYKEIYDSVKEGNVVETNARRQTPVGIRSD